MLCYLVALYIEYLKATAVNWPVKANVELIPGRAGVNDDAICLGDLIC